MSKPHNTIESAILEAVLFAAAKPLPITTLAEILDNSEETVRASLTNYETELEESNRGIRLRSSGAGFELVSAAEYGDYVKKIRQREEVLSKAALETLAIVAFKQPVTKAEIEEVRGVNSDRVIKQLMERELITEIGRKDTLGRPLLFGTTENFLRSVGIESIEALKEDSSRYEHLVHMEETASNAIADDVIGSDSADDTVNTIKEDNR